MHKLIKLKLTKPDLRMCIWVLFQRCKIILDKYKLNMDDDEDIFFEEYLKLKKLNLKKKYSFKY